MPLLNISSSSVQSCGLLGSCDIPYQMLSSASCGILVEILDTVVLKYSSSVRKRSCSISLSYWSGECLCCCGQMRCSANVSVSLLCIWAGSVGIVPSGSSSSSSSCCESTYYCDRFYSLRFPSRTAFSFLTTASQVRSKFAME